VPNPYDGNDFGTVSLWTWDQDHATAERYYLEAPVVFGTVTGLDQRTLGENERAADDLGINPKMAAPLREVAAAEPSAERNSNREHLVPPGISDGKLGKTSTEGDLQRVWLVSSPFECAEIPRC
jgi:hypothetical protein